MKTRTRFTRTHLEELKEMAEESLINKERMKEEKKIRELEEIKREE